jgi:hypothetical protein
LSSNSQNVISSFEYGLEGSSFSNNVWTLTIVVITRDCPIWNQFTHRNQADHDVQNQYNGYGSTGVAKDPTPGNHYLYEEQKASTSPNETHASLVTTTKNIQTLI